MADECGLLNLASCIPQKIYDFFLNVLNAPLDPLLSLVKSLITEPVNLQLYAPLWAIIIYMLSLFYGFLMLYSGFNFILSGYDAVKRERAKEWFRNTLIMIVLVQASYFLYSLVLDLNSLMTAGVMSLIDQNFFRLTADNIINIGLQFFFISIYVLILLLATIILTLRYVLVASGIVFFPIGIFLYFIPPLRGYGKAILNFFGICIFISFFDAIVFLICSKLLDVALFADTKILVMITAFTIANLMMLYFMVFSLFKAAVNLGNKIITPIVMVAKYFA
nr:hypothetical protein [uncultured archaeon]